MRQYLVFIYESYYPEGGWNDFCGDFDTVEEAKQFVQQQARGKNHHIVDWKEGVKIEVLEPIVNHNFTTKIQ